MQSLIIDPPIPYAIPPGPLAIMLVGCGGTGSHLAQSLARLAAHCRDAGLPPVYLSFIDGDVVESKNVGRQLFCPAEIGQNKAQTLAARFNAALGMRIMAIPRMATKDMIWSLIPPDETAVGLVIGAVDSAQGRQVLSDALSSTRCRMWLDCGNHEHSGQVALGTHTRLDLLTGCLKLGGLCTALPAPSLQYPELLRPAPDRPRADCAAAMQDNAQSLMINQMMAAVAGQYISQIAIQRRVTTFQTTVDLQSLSMRSMPITAANLAQACGVTEAILRGEHHTKTKRKKGAVA